MKCLLKLALGGALLVGLLVFGLFTFLDSAIETLLTTGVTYATEQETTLAAVDLDLAEQRASIEGLEIANAPGFRDGPLLRVGEFRTALDPTQDSQEVVRLTELVLDGLELNLELDGTTTNLDPLLQRLEELQQASGDATGEAPAPEGGSDEPAPAGPELSIGRLRVSGLTSRLFVTGLPYGNGDYEVAVPEILIEDFDEAMQQATLAEWSAFVLETLLNSSLSAGQGTFPADWQSLLSGKLEAGGLLDAQLAPLRAEAEQELEKLRDGLMEDPEGTLKEAGEDLEKAGKKAKKALDGLFGKD